MNSKRKSVPLFSAVLTLMAMFCVSCTKDQVTMEIKSERYGRLEDGTDIMRYTLSNGTVTVRLIEYGAAMTELWIPDNKGMSEDVVLGFDSLQGYLGKNPYFGCTVGRYANRIAGGTFTLDGNTYRLATNDGPHHLHGGNRGFDKVKWESEAMEAEESVLVVFRHVSEDGEEGYPGTLSVKVVYRLTRAGNLRITYEAETDQKTIVNLTHHSYYNLAGQGRGDILDHRLYINAQGYTPVDETLIPTGEIRSVEGTPMDVRTPTVIGERIGNVPGGYDHNFVLDRKGSDLELAARVQEPGSGRVLEVWSTEPGIQFYSGNFLDGSVQGKDGKQYNKHFGFCLEPQHFPDSPNHPEFPSTVLEPGETYYQVMELRFGTTD